MVTSTPEPMRVLALSSGTSADAIDVALAHFHPGPEPGSLVMRTAGHLELPWPGALRERILATLPPAQWDVGTWCDLDTETGQAFGDAAAQALDLLGPADLVVSHGQTIFHRVQGDRALGTLQIGQPAWIHARTALPVIHDLRSADIAAGGHGAPLVSLLDALWLGERPTAVLNIGGIANLTMVGVDPLTAGDTGPGCGLLDAAAHELGRAHDADGALALAGTVDEPALGVLLGEEYYRRPFPRSTGREYFHPGYVQQRLAQAGVPVPQGADLFATLTELTARTITDTVRELGGADRIVASGGGVHNPALMARLAALGPPVHTSTDLGLAADAKEAYLFALLGYFSAHGLAGTAPRHPDQPDGPRVTGAGGPAVLGSLTPPMPLNPLTSRGGQRTAESTAQPVRIRRLILEAGER